MNIFNPIKIGVNLSINILSSRYGINCKIYFPTNIKDSKHGFYDDNITYKDTPDIEGKYLIPSIFNLGQSALPGVFDQFSSDERVLYVPNTMNIPKYSLIVAEVDFGILNFRINDEVEYKDDESLIFKKYYLVPVVTHTKDDNDKLPEIQNEFVELENENEFDFGVDYSITAFEDDIDDEIVNALINKEDLIDEVISNANYKPIK